MENNNETVDQEQKTFTQAELDKIVEARVAREREKYNDYSELKEKAKKFDDIEDKNKTELEKLTESNKKLQSQIDAFNAEKELRNVRDKVVKETGLPIELVSKFSGSTVEELTDSAKAFLNFQNSQSGYPKVENASKGKTQTKSKEEQFANWLNNELGG